MIVVSHDLHSLELLCDRVLWLDHGQVRLIGPTKEVIAAYNQQVEEGCAAARGLSQVFGR